jgi:hypothetical protein
MSKQHMSDRHFQELLEGVREMKSIQRGELPPTRTAILKNKNNKTALAKVKIGGIK